MNDRVSVNALFDAGAIELVGAGEDGRIDLRIRRDNNEDFAQWFYCRLEGVRERALTIRFLNAGSCTYPQGWEGYRACASYDRKSWFRVPTEYRDDVMTVSVVPTCDCLYLAYFEPYSWERHLDLLGRCAVDPLCRIETLIRTLDGRDLDLLSIGSRDVRKRVWIIARQHPGETMAEWLVEGMIDRLLDRSDPVARSVLDRATFYLVPNMNPDGAVRGNLRTNAVGANLNREWMEPSQDRSPEVWATRQKMLATGVDLFIDVHGDEALPYVFVAGNEMLPEFTENMRVQQQAFIEDFKRASPDFQDRVGYPAGKYRTDALKLASKWVGHQFNCVSLTLEMPFKDNANFPDTSVGWNGQRSKRLGAAMLEPILHHFVRAEGSS